MRLLGAEIAAAQFVAYPNNPAVSSLRGVPRDSASNYFPIAAATNPNGVQPCDTSIQVTQMQRMDCCWPLVYASEVLFAAQLPVLSNYFSGAETYRFTWLRSFHQPAFLTLQCTADGATLRTQMLNKHPHVGVPVFLDPDEPGLSEKVRRDRRDFKEQMMHDKQWLAQVAFAKAPVAVVLNETVVLTSAQVAQFKLLLDETSFWNEASCQPQMSTDGAYWILEAHEQGRYQFVCRHSPDKNESFRRCCEFLLNVSAIKKQKQY